MVFKVIFQIVAICLCEHIARCKNTHALLPGQLHKGCVYIYISREFELARQDILSLCV